MKYKLEEIKDLKANFAYEDMKDDFFPDDDELAGLSFNSLEEAREFADGIIEKYIERWEGFLEDLYDGETNIFDQGSVIDGVIIYETWKASIDISFTMVLMPDRLDLWGQTLELGVKLEDYEIDLEQYIEESDDEDEDDE